VRSARPRSEPMTIDLRAPSTDPRGLDELKALWIELHEHHRRVADYRDLVEDAEASWQRRRSWYGRLLAEGGAYITAVHDAGRPVGYTVVTVSPGPDDTFASEGAIAEVVTLVVAAGTRSAGVGAALLTAAEEFAAGRGADVVRIEVMTGNDRASAFYERHGYAVAEQVLYRRLSPRRTSAT
jgi:ribosomal protein S18 acetylase RimI-like enzyme